MRRPNPTGKRIVAVLCTSHRTPYKHLTDVEVWDRKADALNYAGGHPIVAHPPCRAWSIYTRHQSKPSQGEKDLGIKCTQLARRNGGIIEQPAHSLLWEAAGLPHPGKIHNPLSYSLEICQEWWGHPCIKRTWLYFSGIPITLVNLPFCLHSIQKYSSTWANLTPHQRSATPPLFAQWLVDLARQSTQPAGIS
jgi:hypothetical protein